MQIESMKKYQMLNVNLLNIIFKLNHLKVLQSVFGEFLRTIFSIETHCASSISVNIIGWYYC